MTRHPNTVTWYAHTIAAVIILFLLLSCQSADANIDALRSSLSRRTSSSDAGSSSSSPLHHQGDLLVSNPRPHSPTTGLLGDVVNHATKKPASSSLHPPQSSQTHSAHPPEHPLAHTTHPESSARPSEGMAHPTSSAHPSKENVQRLGKAHVGASGAQSAVKEPKRPRRWWNTPGGAPPRRIGTSAHYLRQQRKQEKQRLAQAGVHMLRLPAGTGDRYEEGVRWRAKDKARKLAAQQAQTNEHSSYHKPPHGGGPGSPGAGSHAVSKRQWHRN
ncbi:unnamed protein product [Sympodiomycopsis kandeliae]